MMKSGRFATIKVMAVSLAAGLFFWLLDGLVGFFLHDELSYLMTAEPAGSLLESLILAIPSYHLFIRIFVVLVCLAGGIVVSAGIRYRMRYQAKLEESNRNLNQAQALANLGSWEWDLSSNNLQWSDGLYRIWGVGKPAFPLSQEAIIALIHPDDRDLNQQMQQKVADGYDSLDWEFRIVRPDGKIRHIYQNVETQRDRDGKLRQVNGTMMDVTESKQTNLALVESQRRYQSLFEDSPISLWEEDLSAVKEAIDSLLKQGIDNLDQYLSDHPEELKRLAYLKIFQDVNQATVAMYRGKDRSDTLRAFTTFYSDVSRQVFKQEILAFLQGQRSFAGEAWHSCVDGTEIFVSFHIGIAPGYEENWGKVFVSNLDITQSKEAEEEVRKRESNLRALYDSMTELFVRHELVYDENGKAIDYRIMDCNPMFTKVTGITQEQAAGKLASEVYGVEPAPFLAIYTKVAETGEPQYFETHFEPMQKYFAVSVFSPERGHFATVSSDITKRKRDEAQILQMNELLEERVEERTQELKEANAELEAFAYSISHDLRAPLRAIDGFSRILQDEYMESLCKDANHYIDLLRKNAIAMSDLVNGLLEFSRKGRQPVNLEAVDVNSMVKALLEPYRSQEEFRDTEFILHPLPDCYADLQLIRQVWFNLLDNAVKFSHTKEKPKIEVWGDVNTDEIMYTIKDNGVGFDMTYADRLFGVFQRLHRSEEFEGTGVGLAIIHRIIHRHGGRVWVDAIPDEGATFFFTLLRYPGEQYETRENGHDIIG